jgi:hypothetical protein
LNENPFFNGKFVEKQESKPDDNLIKELNIKREDVKPWRFWNAKYSKKSMANSRNHKPWNRIKLTVEQINQENPNSGPYKRAQSRTHTRSNLSFST